MSREFFKISIVYLIKYYILEGTWKTMFEKSLFCSWAAFTSSCFRFILIFTFRDFFLSKFPSEYVKFSLDVNKLFIHLRSIIFQVFKQPQTILRFKMGTGYFFLRSEKIGARSTFFAPLEIGAWPLFGVSYLFSTHSVSCSK